MRGFCTRSLILAVVLNNCSLSCESQDIKRGEHDLQWSGLRTLAFFHSGAVPFPHRTSFHCTADDTADAEKSESAEADLSYGSDSIAEE